jgi:hypothetical protein
MFMEFIKETQQLRLRSGRFFNKWYSYHHVSSYH